MIKVLHFVSTPAIWSGVMSVIMNYYRHIDRTKVQFDFLCFAPCEESYEAEIDSLGGTVWWIPKPNTIAALKDLGKFLKEHGNEYAWFHNHEVYLSFMLQPMAKKYGIKNFIVHSHATKYSDRRAAALRNGILCKAIRFMNCRKFACSTEAGKFLFGEREFKKNTVYILHNAIDTKRFTFNTEQRTRSRTQLNWEDCFIIGHVGRFVPQKNHLFLLHVYAGVLKGCPDVRLLLIGDGPQREEMEQECSRLGIQDFVCIAGQQPQIERFYPAMDLLVLPSIFEGIGVALLEAQASGLHCLASDQVPREAAVTENVQFLPLDLKIWTAECLKSAWKKKREHSAGTAGQLKNTFIEKHYEIQTEAERLQAYYENTDFNVCI